LVATAVSTVLAILVFLVFRDVWTSLDLRLPI
jgi:hypothetical protein